MEVRNEMDNLVFDDSDPRCYLEVVRCHGANVAFIQCLDIGWPDNRLSQPGLKRYFGFWDPDEPEASIRQILKDGGKWPRLAPNHSDNLHD